MTAVHPPLPAAQRHVFQAVFPPGTLRPHQDKARSLIDATTTKVNVREQLENDSRQILGIGSHAYRYSKQPPQIAYSTDFSRCPSMGHADSWPSCRMRQAERCDLLQSRGQMPIWLKFISASEVKKIFASVVDVLLTEFVKWNYGGTYSEECREHLAFWVENIFAPFLTDLVWLIDHPQGEKFQWPPPTAPTLDLSKWQDMALTRLGALRTAEIFDIIIEWPHTESGIDDLKAYTTSPASRSYVTSEFARTLQIRLLHPGASTVEILRVYICIIRAFRRLDPRGVLLERVARKIRRYLRDREDTVRVIVTGLLSETQTPAQKSSRNEGSLGRRSYRKSDPALQPAPDAENLTELAYELQDRDANATKSTGWASLDWNNMSWQPDPVDAAPDYLKAAASTDVIGGVISLFESKDMVVKELQQSLAERLLRNRTEYDQEVAVIEHLKIQFGDSALQACEVMLRDVLDSKRLDSVIRADQGLDTSDTQTSDEAQLHAKILSRLFWPSLPGADTEHQFKLPIPILEQRTRYERGFETLKQTRRLNWNDHIGSVKISLDFDDGRNVSEEVLPSQASVIYAFQEGQDDLGSGQQGMGIVRSVANLAEQLDMDAILVRSACMFWVSRQVLVAHSTLRDIFGVLEHLPNSTSPTTIAGTSATTDPSSTTAPAAQSQAQASAAAAAAAAAAQRSAEAAERKSKLSIYNQLVTSMLTNGGPMALPQISMMLGMVVPGGFPYGDGELGVFLEGMVREEKLKVVGGGRFAVA